MASKKDTQAQKYIIPVPAFDENNYEAWRKDVSRWCIISKLEPRVKAYNIHISLTGRAKTTSNLIPDEDLMSEDGVKILLGKLDDIYIKNKHFRKFDLFSDIYKLRKDKKTSMHDYICDFQHTYDKFRQEKAEIEDTVLAYIVMRGK